MLESESPVAPDKLLVRRYSHPSTISLMGMSRRKQEKPLPRKRSLSEDDAAESGELLLGKDARTTDRLKQEKTVDVVEEKKLLDVNNRISADPEQTSVGVQTTDDLLTCGICQKEFTLAEIVKFIQHKVHNCNKENCRLLNFAEHNGSDGATSPVPAGARCSRSSSKHRHARSENGSSNNLSGETDDCDGATSPLSCSDPSRGLVESPKQEPCSRPSTPSSNLDRKSILVDADTNTTYTEPNNYTCFTCKHGFHSAWLLVQHAQNVHGMKIYMIPNAMTPPGLFSPEHRSPRSTPSAHHAATPGLPADVPIPPILENHPALQLLRLPPNERPPFLTHPVFGRGASSHPLDLLKSSPDQVLRAGTHYNKTSTPTPTPFNLGIEPQLDFYSQRLRQLAGATSPNAAVAALSAVTSAASGGLCKTTHHPTSSSPPVTLKNISSSEQALSSSKSLSCDICGKSFRFESNLIVHRRQHTDDGKTFRCHICNFTCSGASKLKKHMRTVHNSGSKMSEGTVHDGVDSSARSTPDSSKITTNGVNNEDLESTINDDDDADEEMDEDEEDFDEERNTSTTPAEGNGDVAEDLTVQRAPTASSTSSITPSPAEKPSRTRMPPTSAASMAQMLAGVAAAAAAGGGVSNSLRKSLLGEVMEKIGLTNIQQYSEAYKQALEESNNIKQERPTSASSMVNGGSSISGTSETGIRPSSAGTGSTRTLPHGPLDFGGGLMPPTFDGTPLYESSKRQKLSSDRPDSILPPGLWLPSMAAAAAAHRDMYNHLGLPRPDSGVHDNPFPRLSKSVVGSEMLSSVLPGTSSSMASALLGGANGPAVPKIPRGDRRNDTCEYCGKVFKNCSNLTVHRRSHTGEKPYKCELCSYACAQSSKLTRHMKTHGRIGKDVYRCRFCEMPFSVPSTLEKHMRKCVVNQGSAVMAMCGDSDSKDERTPWRSSSKCGSDVDSSKGDLSPWAKGNHGSTTDLSVGGDSDSKEMTS